MQLAGRTPGLATLTRFDLSSDYGKTPKRSRHEMCCMRFEAKLPGNLISKRFNCNSPRSPLFLNRNLNNGPDLDELDHQLRAPADQLDLFAP